MDLGMIISEYGIYVLVLLGVSESLALMPFLKANSVLQLVLNVLKQAVALLGIKKPE